MHGASEAWVKAVDSPQYLNRLLRIRQPMAYQGCLVRARLPLQNRSRPRQSLTRTRESERQQVLDVFPPGRRGGGFACHETDFRCPCTGGPSRFS